MITRNLAASGMAAITVAALSLLTAPAWVAAAPQSLTVEAGAHDRVDSLVTFEIKDLPAGDYLLDAGEAGNTPLQVDAQGQGAFQNLSLKKGESRTYAIKPAPQTRVAVGVSARKDGAVVKVNALKGGQPSIPLLSYQTTASPVPGGTPPIFSHGGYVHPVYTPAGKVVTGDYPSDHPHHRGIWLSWTKTSFEGRSPDFWNMGKDKSGKLTGEVRFGTLDAVKDGIVFAQISSTHRWLDHTSGAEKPVLNEALLISAYAPSAQSQGVHLFDITSTQTTAGSEPLKLPKYHYGGLGVRGSAEWDPENKVSFLTSNGDDRKKGDSTPAKWVHLGGEVEGSAAGLAVLIHPENFRFPQPLRLNPKNPQLSVAPPQGGDFAIEPGKPYVSRYRFVALDGAADAAALERLWTDYAHPPKVSVK